MRETGKKVIAGGVAGVMAITGGVIAHQAKKHEPEYLEPSTSLTQEYKEPIPSSESYTIDGKTFSVSNPTTGIFGEVVETTQAKVTTTSENLENNYEFVLPSRFNSIEELYAHYEKVWQTRSMGKSALQIISEVDLIDEELSVAAALQYLKEMGKDPLDYLYQLKLTQVACLTTVVDANLAEQLMPLISLFPKGYEYMVVKSYVRLANEFTAFIDVKNGVKAIIFDNMVYLTPEVIELAEGFGIILDGDLVIFIQSQNNIETKVRK